MLLLIFDATSAYNPTCRGTRFPRGNHAAQCTLMTAELPDKCVEDLTIDELTALCQAKGLQVSGPIRAPQRRQSGRQTSWIRRLLHRLFRRKQIAKENEQVSITKEVAREDGVLRRLFSRKRFAMEEKVVDVPEAKPVQELVDIARDVPDNVTKQVIGDDAPIDDANAGVDEFQAVADIEEIVAEVLVEEDSQGSTSAVVEVLGQEQAEDFDDAEYIKQQRERRRARLSRYLTEEVSVENATGSAIGINSFQASSLALPSDPLAPSVNSAAQGAAEQQGDVQGRHLAWCREFDAASGRGVLIDLKERTEWPVNREALLTSGKNSPSSAFLHAGEFVEYKLESARELSTGDEPAGGWVSGIFGWPLMCETAADPTIAKKFRKKQ